jgi:hypothetical protein
MEVLAHPHMPGIDVVRLEPFPVVSEVRADRTHQHRPQPEPGHAERDVSRDAAAVDLQLVHQEGQGHLVELPLDQLLGEAAREDHQMIGRDGPGNDLPHQAHRSAVTSVADSRRRSALSVCSQVKSGSWRPKCP